jgi:hypothetical protein
MKIHSGIDLLVHFEAAAISKGDLDDTGAASALRGAGSDSTAAAVSSPLTGMKAAQPAEALETPGNLPARVFRRHP